jgi:hypothetical protein
VFVPLAASDAFFDAHIFCVVVDFPNRAMITSLDVVEVVSGVYFKKYGIFLILWKVISNNFQLFLE